MKSKIDERVGFDQIVRIVINIPHRGIQETLNAEKTEK
jgi:hypothetical protein